MFKLASKSRIFSFVILLAVLVNSAAFAQVTSKVTGVVTDNSGAAVRNATVTLTNEATNVSFVTNSTSTGAYVFEAVQPGTYKLNATSAGFKTYISTGIGVTVGEPSVVNIVLQVGALNEVVQVTAAEELVQTSTSGNFGTLISQEAVTTLPIVGARGRNPLQFVELQPGVVDAGGFNQSGANVSGGGVSVNGSRDRAWNYTLDGIDINETSAGGSNFSPVRTNPDSISEFRTLTHNFTAEYGRNSGAEVLMVTKSGSNEYHGNAFFFYQTPALQANEPINKVANQKRQQFVQRIPGFSVGGPIFKNKTFFFTNVQFLRTLRTFSTTSLVYTDAARKGQFRYVTIPAGCKTNCPRNQPAGTAGASVDSNGNVLPGVSIATYNVVANDPAKIGLDASTAKVIGLTPLPNDFKVGDGLNIAGFDFVAPEIEKQTDWTIKIDHVINDHQSVFARWYMGHQNTTGDTGNGGLQAFPNTANVVDTRRTPRNLALGHRWTITPRFTNEFIAGMNRFTFDFANPDKDFRSNPAFGLNNVTNPLQNYVGNRRVLTTLQWADNMSYARGAHSFKWGTNIRYQRHIDDRGSIGSLGASPFISLDPSINDVGAAFNLPANINGTFDLPVLQAAVNDLLGRVGKISQGLVAQNDNTFAPAGTHLHDDFRLPEYDFYGQDTWRLLPNLTMDIGLRWEPRPSPHSPSNFRPNQPVGFGLPGSNTLTWVRGDLYKADYANFSPSIGFAWDPFSDGKNSIRANYRLAHDRINSFSLSSGVYQGIPGATFQAIDTSYGQGGGRLPGVPTLTAIAGVTPASLRTPPSFSTASITVMDPNWKPASVHEWTLGYQHQFGLRTLMELDYVGHKGLHLYGGYDANQVDIVNNGFLNAFRVVAAGGDSALINQLLQNDSRRKAGETGSQMLRRSGSPYFSAFNQGSVAGVAQLIAQRTQSGVPLVVVDGFSPLFFDAFPQFTGGFNVLDSNDISTYHALQAQLRRQLASGLYFQANYTWSKSLDTRSFDPTFSRVGRGSSPFSASSTPFDLHNRRLNYAPSDFDRTNVFQFNGVYELPFGHGKTFGGNWNGLLDRIAGGWEIAGFGVWESGRPTTVFSPANTLSQVVRTPANCTGCSSSMLQIHTTPSGDLNYYTPAQVAQFSTPAPGTFSNVGRNFFRLAGYKVASLSVLKKTRITERQNIETRLEIQNLTNSEQFDQPASNLFTSPSFGNLNPVVLGNFGLSLSSSSRKMQVSVKYNF